MYKISSCKVISYQCAHCKQVSHGEPPEIMVIEKQELAMCCLGCVCAAELMIGLHQCKLSPKIS